MHHRRLNAVSGEHLDAEARTRQLGRLGRGGQVRGDAFMRLVRKREVESTTVAVPCDGLGSLLASRNVLHVDIISIDVESYEVPLLRCEYLRVRIRAPCCSRAF